MIHFRVLGGIELRTAGGFELRAVLAQPKRLALLAYLALAEPRGFHRRDTLLPLFWPEQDDERARDALNQAVYYLRRELGRDVLRSRGREELAIDSEAISCDAVEFARLLHAGSRREALELYGGELLRGLFVSDALEWERWLEAERVRLAVLAADAAWALVEEAAGAGNALEVTRWARRWLGLAPGDETRLGRLIVTLDRLGERAGAVQLYAEAAGRLAREFDLEPGPEVRRLIEELRASNRLPVDPASKERPPSAKLVAALPEVSSGSPPPGRQEMVRPGSASNGASPRRRYARPALLKSVGLVGVLAAVGVAFWPQMLRDSQPAAVAAGDPALNRGNTAQQPTDSVLAQHAGRRSRSPAAFAEYLKGRHYLGRVNAEAVILARGHFERAVDLDPTFAHAWSGLALAFNQLSALMVYPAAEAYPRARAAAERALELDPTLGEAHAALGTVLASYYWDTDAAERHFVLGVQNEPESARVRRLYAAHLRNLRKFDEALLHARRAQQLDPLFAFSYIDEGIILYHSRRFDEAFARFREYLRVMPDDAHAYIFLAMLHVQRGEYDEALEAVNRTDPQGMRPDAQTYRGIVYARMGRRADAVNQLGVLDSIARQRGTASAFHKAAVHVALGEHERALDLLEAAAERPTWQLRLLNVEPSFDALRDYPRFNTLLRRLGFPGAN